MPKRSHQNRLNSLARMLTYILGNRPDEFGLLPDSEGFVTFRELLQALHEEDGWHYVRRSHLNEVLLGKDRSLFQADDKVIKVFERRWKMDFEDASQTVPKILFAPVRRRAHPVVMEKGLKSGEGSYQVLCTDKDMALRIGKRRDQKPVLLEILASAAAGKGVSFQVFGKLFLAPFIPAEFISGPPVSQEILEGLKEAKEKKDQLKSKPSDFAPGTFPLDASRDPDLRRRAKGKKQKSWKESARKMRRHKR
jgi:putative RNA 2'-phosphotransferase